MSKSSPEKRHVQSSAPAPSTVGFDGLSFEKALGEIEAIIERIEAGEIGLEEALGQYERGVALVNHCRGKLDRAQQQVEDLTRRLEQADEDPSAAGEGDADDHAE